MGTVDRCIENKMKSPILIASVLAVASADTVREIHTLTADCTDCGMTAFGQLSVIICGQAASSSPDGQCCVAMWLSNNQNNFLEGQTDIFAGPASLGECYEFDLGAVNDVSQTSITMYHTGT